MPQRLEELKRDTLPLVGTVYAVSMGNGEYGFARILSTRTPNDSGLDPFERVYSAFVAAVRTVHSQLLVIDDVRLRDFASDGRGDICGVWVGSPPPKEYEAYGVLAVTGHERKQITNSWSGWELISATLFELSGQPMYVKPKSADRLDTKLPRRKSLPFQEWIEFRDPKLVRQLQQLAHRAEKKTSMIRVDSSGSEKLAIICDFVEAINILDAKQQFVTSIERDSLLDFLIRLGDSVGLNERTVENYVTRWRTW